MKIDKLHFENKNWVVGDERECESNEVNIVFVFGDLNILKDYNHSALLKKMYPNADIVGASGSGNILDDGLSEHGAIATAISFDKGWVAVNSSDVHNETINSDAKTLVESLEKENLKHIFVLAQGLNIDASKLVEGVNENSEVSVTGGLAADGNVFESTYVFANAKATEHMAVAVGFYGDSIHVGVGCKAGWEEFGSERVVTSADSNRVYEIDNRPAIELYEKYLGEYIKDLPASGLLFPLSVKTDESEKNEVIRVMMGINEDKSISFAGAIAEGSVVRLMKTNIDNLIDGAELVANSIEPYNDKRSLSLVVSCSGRLSVLKQLADEEVEVMQKVLTDKSQLIGFYSYGEIAPFSNDLLNCKLHNQTMTLTTIYED